MLDNPCVVNDNRIECCVIMNVAASRDRCIREYSRNIGFPLFNDVIDEIAMCAGYLG